MAITARGWLKKRLAAPKCVSFARSEGFSFGLSLTCSTLCEIKVDRFYPKLATKQIANPSMRRQESNDKDRAPRKLTK
eukprot:6475368-Amphidinium_carterae.1